MALEQILGDIDKVKLRHDFSDYFMMLSTHETDYGKLLEYKLKKWDVDTEYIEMSQLHKK